MAVIMFDNRSFCNTCIADEKSDVDVIVGCIMLEEVGAKFMIRDVVLLGVD